MILNASRLTICVDIDNVVAQTDVVMRDLIYRYTGGRVKLLYEDIREFDYWKCPDCNGGQLTKEQWDEVHNLFSMPQVVSELLLIDGAQAQINALGEKYSVHLVTSRKPSVLEATWHWLTKHGIRFDDLVFAPHGGKHKLPTRYAFVIEDHYEQAKAFAEDGVNAILIDHPWNRGKPSHKFLSWAPNWDHIQRTLL